MREILFRGKRKDNGEWIYGVPITDEATNDAYIITSTAGASLKSEINNMCATGFRIIRNTVGQYTGLTDKNGTRIFEGDILGYSEQSKLRYLNNVRFVVLYENFNACFVVERYVNGNYKLQKRLATFNPSKHLEVIGNVYDNPELLKCDNRK